jgi:hypothetical protein
MSCALAIDAQPTALVDTVESAFDARTDIDRCAHVTLRAKRGNVAVTVELPDGRLATRVVPEADLISALEALLVVPPSPAPEPEVVVEPPPSPALEPVIIIVPPLPIAPDVIVSPKHASATTSIEASVATSGHAGTDRFALGLGGEVLLDVHGWLGGFRGRIDGYNGTPQPAVISAGAPFGRRMRAGSMTVDLTLAPMLAYLGTQTEVHEMPQRTVILTRQPTLPRLQGAVRLNFRADSRFRTFLGLDAELGPGGRDLLPPFTVGLALGATVGS